MPVGSGAAAVGETTGSHREGNKVRDLLHQSGHGSHRFVERGSHGERPRQLLSGVSLAQRILLMMAERSRSFHSLSMCCALC